MDRKSLFVTASPLQLLNAIEAANHFTTSYNILVLIYNSSLNNNDLEQKLSLLNINEWDEIIYYDLGKIAKKKRFFEQVKLIKKLKKDAYSYFFSGDFGTIQQALMANLEIDNIYLLDDGTASIVIYNRLKNKLFFNKISFSKKMKLIRYLFVNLKYKINQKINFFTIYNLESLAHMDVIQHDFSHLKQSQLSMCKKSKNIYILGQNLIEVGWIEEEKYLEYLKKIIEKIIKNHDGNIIYKPHRSEKITEAYNHLISERFSIEEDIVQGPIETSLIYNKIYPQVIISFFSSALFSLDKVFENSLIYSIKIKDSDLIHKGNNISVINSCYTFLKATKVQSLDLFEEN